MRLKSLRCVCLSCFKSSNRRLFRSVWSFIFYSEKGKAGRESFITMKKRSCTQKNNFVSIKLFYSLGKFFSPISSTSFFFCSIPANGGVCKWRLLLETCHYLAVRIVDSTCTGWRVRKLKKGGGRGKALFVRVAFLPKAQSAKWDVKGRCGDVLCGCSSKREEGGGSTEKSDWN